MHTDHITNFTCPSLCLIASNNWFSSHNILMNNQLQT